MQSFTLQELFCLTKEGDTAAFSALYQQTWQKLYQLAFNKTRDEEESKDIIQDIYIQLWKKKEGIQIQGSIEAYLYTMTKHEIIRRMQQFLKLEEQKFDYQQMIDSFAASGDQEIFAEELGRHLKREIAALPEKQQRIFRLHNEENYTTKQIAKELDIAEQTVKNQLVHAKKKIRSGIKTHIFSMMLFF